MHASDLVFLVFAGLAAWFLLIRPQRARAQALQGVREALSVGRRVITTAGLHATVASVDEETVLLEIAPGVRARFDPAAVVRVLPDPEPEPGTQLPGGDAPRVPDQGEPPAD
jgi:preprotein translocase subunit YajC